MAGEYCKSCRWFEPAEDYFDEDGDMSEELVNNKNEYGFCRRHAPAPCPFNADNALEVNWPLVWMHEWCGEWKQQEATHGR